MYVYRRENAVMAKKMLVVIVSLGLALSACDKRKPDVLTGDTEVPQIESSIQEEQDFITRVDVWIANHPCYTAEIAVCMLAAGGVGYWCYNRYQPKKVMIDYIEDDPFAPPRNAAISNLMFPDNDPIIIQPSDVENHAA
jgi:ribosomal protein L31